ncbi:MAG TPA: hypothetical protein G4O02_10500 [Caldilineae bacterium]|nr:hypothetical protein [Caldilineae bacterium]
MDPLGLSSGVRTAGREPSTHCIVCFGDSITRGYGLPEGRSWPSLLEAALRAREDGGAWIVVNAGVPGDTILQGLARLERDVLSHHPDVAFIAFGINDAHLARRKTDVYREQALWEDVQCRPWRKAIVEMGVTRHLRPYWRRLRSPSRDAGMATLHPEPIPRVSLPAFRRALEVIVERLREARPGIYLFLVTPTPITEHLHPEWPAELRRRQHQVFSSYVSAVREAAATLGTGLVDAYRTIAQGDMRQLVGSDGVHLTIAGQRQLAEAAYRAMAEAGLVTCKT